LPTALSLISFLNIFHVFLIVQQLHAFHECAQKEEELKEKRVNFNNDSTTKLIISYPV